VPKAVDQFSCDLLKNLTENRAQFGMRLFPEGKILLLLRAGRRFAEAFIIVFVFATAWKEGQIMTREQTIALALESE
jgi:hypothetical protein